MISSIDHVLERVRWATPKSPLIVLRTQSKDLYDSRFASTIAGQYMLRHDDRVIAILHQGMLEKDILAALR